MTAGHDHHGTARGEHDQRGPHERGHAHGLRPAPLEADTEAVGGFVLGALAQAGVERGPLLEVGAGDGALARWLGARGVDVTAIDVSPEAVARAEAAGNRVLLADFHHFDPGERPVPFRAVAFTLSLHHIDRLEAAVARAAALAPGGLILLDEFAFEQADAAAAAFFFDQRAVLAAAGLHRGEEFEPEGDALAAWDRRYRDEHPIARGEEMLEHLARHCSSVTVQPGPHLARLVAFYLDGGRPDAAAVIDRLRALEAARIDAGTLPAIGLRVVGRVAEAG